MNHEHVSQFVVGRFKRAEPLAAFDVRRKGVRHSHRCYHLRLVEAVEDFVDEVAVATPVERRFECLANDAPDGGLLHRLRQV